MTVVPNWTPLGVALFLLAAGGLSLIRGWLVTRTVMQALIAVKDAELVQAYKDRDYWRSAWLAESEARRHADGQVADLLELARLTERSMSLAIQATPPLPRGTPDGG